MTNLTINFNFPTAKPPVRFQDIPEGPFMGHFGSDPKLTAVLQIKGYTYTYNVETHGFYLNGDKFGVFVHNYRPVHITMIVNDAPSLAGISKNDC